MENKELISNTVENNSTVKKSINKSIIVLIVILFICLISGIYALSILNKKESISINQENYDINIQKVKIVNIPETKNVEAFLNSEFGFTISPSNQWLLYVTNDYPNRELVVFDLLNNKKFIIDTEDLVFEDLVYSMKNDCWSQDSRYCVFSINGSNNPDIVIDFINEKNPVFINQTKDTFLTFEQISPNGLTCSDCTEINQNTNTSYDLTFDRTSPNEKFLAKQIREKTIGIFFQSKLSPPNLYITNQDTGKQILIDKNVYGYMHFTSDSNKLYYYDCKEWRNCDSYTISYLDLSSLNK